MFLGDKYMGIGVMYLPADLLISEVYYARKASGLSKADLL
jgi:hypothetical protein